MRENPHSIRFALSLLLGCLVFLFVVLTTTLVTFILPATYAGTARIQLYGANTAQNPDTNAAAASLDVHDPYQLLTELHIIQSEIVLRRVIEQLDLNAVWGKRYLGGEKLTTTDSLQLLKERLEANPIRGVGLMRISVFSEDPSEAAELANAVAEAYQKDLQENDRGFRARIVDRAAPPLRPARPNKPLNLALGVGTGLAFGVVCGWFCFWVSGRRRKHSSSAPPPVDATAPGGSPRAGRE